MVLKICSLSRWQKMLKLRNNSEHSGKLGRDDVSSKYKVTSFLEIPESPLIDLFQGLILRE